ncbi:MAG: histidinol-phosphate transaminase [Oscillospiraceae bacterium]|nr:histidinol-phosphate transaminase [Oscillospiraceae bacterium]
MSRFLSAKYKKLVPYTPGEQPKDMQYVKLNTNESPFPPSKKAQEMAAETAKKLQLYSDPECKILRDKLAETFGVKPTQVIATNGSDEILNFAFMAYCDENTPAAFADITYGFYPVFADVNNVPYELIPLKEDFSINITDYFNLGKTIFIANPNAPTGMALSKNQIAEILKNNPDNIVVIDEAYVDFGAESCVDLVKEFDNLLVTQTFSKSRSMAGARLGFGIASEAVISDLNTIRYSTNPYNVNSMTLAAGYGVLCDEEYTKANCKKIAENREWFVSELKELGYEVLPSLANFVFAKNERLGGRETYLKLKEKGILVRQFEKERISQYLRITIGTKEQLKTLLSALKEILEETK